eukprot:TRINITY_DN3887_c0_g1_i4.p1 TRINITY_DN3887_c0_g1~~TRINITY_DN3887_c0_g1_i4.p1  ORF type:complete len:350 (-),score=18.33 TRINITY_DN3887_c0_g1_i4:76-1125(-)
MSGRSFSAKNLVVAVIAAIALSWLPLFVPTGAIGFAPTIATETLLPAEIESELLSPYASAPAIKSTYLSPPAVNMPSFDSFTKLCWDLEDRDLWRDNPRDSHPKKGRVESYCTVAEKQDYNRLRIKIKLRTALSAVYAPYMVDRWQNLEDRCLNGQTLCSTFLTPFHFFVMVPDDLDGEFTALFNNESLPTKVCYSSDTVWQSIYVFTHPTTDILPNYSETLDVGLAATASNNLPKGKCRDFVVTQFQGLRKIMDVFQGYLECKGEDGRVQRAEEVNIFLHWLIYFAKNFPAVFEEPTQHERPHEIMDFPPAESDKGFFLPAFEAMLEGIAEATELRFKNFEREHDANP